MPSRPSVSRLIASHRSRTRDAVRASASPKTCGCRETSFAWMPRAAASRSPAPRSERSSARKYDWKSRSPTSSCSFASSPASAASATSYASSTVCGTIVRAVCSRSHGHSRRRRSVSSWSSTSASARDTGLTGGRRGGRRRRAGIRRRLVPDLVLDLLAGAEVLRRRGDPVGHRLVLLLLDQLLLDRARDVLLRSRLTRLDRAERLDDEPRLVLRRVVEGLVHDLGRRRERDLVENRNRLALGERRLAAVLARRVLRVLLRERAPGLVVAVLQLLVHGVSRGLVLADEDVAQVARLRLRVLLRVRDVVLVDVVVRHLRARRHLVEDGLGDELRADVLAHLLVRELLLLQLSLV